MEYSVPHKVTIRLHKATQHLKVRYRYPIINLKTMITNIYIKLEKTPICKRSRSFGKENGICRHSDCLYSYNILSDYID